MPIGLPEFLVGQRGVQLTTTPLHTPDGGLLAAQNIEFSHDKGIGGLALRGGLARLNGSALAGSVLHIANLPFGFPTDQVLMLGMNAGETESWKSSTDGTSFSDLTTSQLQRANGAQQFSTTVLVPGNFYMGQRAASYRRRFYYLGDDYLAWVNGGGGNYSAPPVIQWDGTQSFEMFRIPNNPWSVVGSFPWWIADMHSAFDFIYLAVYDPGGSAPNPMGRVLRFDPALGTLALVGNRFGDNDASENNRGYPHALFNFVGRVYCGTNAISGSSGQMGSIWSIQDGVDEAWTEEHQLTGALVGVMSFATYNGSLYAATAAGVATNALILTRTSTGSWGTSFTAATAGVSYIGGLIEYDGDLYACTFHAVTSTLIKKYDGSSWTTDKDVGVDEKLDFCPGTPFVFGGDLFWPFFDTSSDSNTTGFLLKKSGGTWSKLLDTIGPRGCMGFYQPDAS